MKKIPTIFARNYETDRLVRDEVTPGCEWVLAGEGIATPKWDGTCCMVRDGVLYRRHDRKRGKPAPEGWEPCEPEPDLVTGHWPGWVPVGDGPEDRWHREGFAKRAEERGGIDDGTYELIGPKVQGNPHDMRHGHWLVDHGGPPLAGNFRRTFDGIRSAVVAMEDFEGIVFHHPDGRMAKIKRRDFGLTWPVRS